MSEPERKGYTLEGDKIRDAETLEVYDMPALVKLLNRWDWTVMDAYRAQEEAEDAQQEALALLREASAARKNKAGRCRECGFIGEHPDGCEVGSWEARLARHRKEGADAPESS